MYPWEQPGWPDLVWSDAALSGLLARASREHGRLLGKMETLGFGLRDETCRVFRKYYPPRLP